MLTLAYLHTRATRSDMAARLAVKCRLIRMLYVRNWKESAIREFLKEIDWMMALPPGLAKQLNSFVGELEEEKRMEYVTSIERVRLAQVRETALNEGERKGEQKGEQKGKRESHADMLSRLLVCRFGPLPVLVVARIKSASSA